MSKTETLHGAMAAAFGEIEGATKSANNPHFKSKYADLGAVIDAIKPALIKHGLFFTQRPQPSDGGVTVETVIGHASGEEMSLGSLFVPANKNDAQAFGSALTYARRYALVTAFGVPVEDDDGNAAAQGQHQQGKVSPAAAISDDQLTQLEQLIPAAKLTPAQFNQTFGIARTKDLPAARFDEAMNRLNTRIGELAKADTNKEAVDA